MNPISQTLRALLLLPLLAGSLLHGAINYYVSPAGSDANAGTLGSPFLTLTKARDVVRTLVTGGLTDHVVIHLRAGTYRLASALDLTTADTGNATYSITWRGYGTEMAIITSERAITGSWTNVSGNLWKINIPDVASGSWRFRTLSVGQAKATRAKEPDAGWYTLNAVDGTRKILTLVDDIPTGWTGITGAELNTTAHWHYNRQDLASINGTTNQVTSTNKIGSDASGSVISTSSHSRVWLENALEFVDEPGEWFVNNSTGDLYYQVASGNPSSLSFDAPRLATLITVRGTSNAVPVKNVHFTNLVLRGTDWAMTAQERRGVQAGAWAIDATRTYSPPAALIFEYAQDCGFADSVATDLGEGAVALERGSRTIAIDNNAFQRVGANVIQVARIPEYTGSGHPLHFDYADANDAPSYNTITYNEIVDSCDADYGSVGILVGYAHHTTIQYNRIARLPYTAISVGWRWASGTTNCHDNIIDNNFVEEVMGHCGDGGAIYLVGEQAGTKVRNNYVRHLGGNYWAHGVYPDMFSDYMEFSGNYAQGPADYAIFRHQNGSSMSIHDNNGDSGTTPDTGTTTYTKWTIFNPERTPLNLSPYGPTGATASRPVTRDFEANRVEGWRFDAEGSGAYWNLALNGGNRQLRCTNTTATSQLAFFGAADWTTLTATIDVTSATDVTGAYPALLFRVNDANNFYMMQLRMGENTVRLYKRVGGTYTQLGSDVATTLNAATTYTVKIEAQGSSLKTYVNNVLKHTVTDSTFVRGRAGLRSYGADTSFDNLTVDAPASGGDDFEDGNSTGWSFVEGVTTGWSVVTDGATKRLKQADTSGGSRIALLAGAWSDFDASAVIKCDTDQTGDYPGFLFRAVDANNLYMFQLRMGENTLRLYKRIGGTYTQIGSDVATTLSASTAYDVRVVASGSLIQTYLDGVLKHTATDTALTTGSLGFRSYDAPTAIDDVLVSAP